MGQLQHGVVVKSVDHVSGRPGFDCLIGSNQGLKNWYSHLSLLGAQHLRESVKTKPVISLVVSLGKALNGIPPPLSGRQVTIICSVDCNGLI